MLLICLKISLYEAISEFLPLADGEGILDDHLLFIEVAQLVAEQGFFHLRDSRLDVARAELVQDDCLSVLDHHCLLQDPHLVLPCSFVPLRHWRTEVGLEFIIFGVGDPLILVGSCKCFLVALDQSWSWSEWSLLCIRSKLSTVLAPLQRLDNWFRNRKEVIDVFAYLIEFAK